MSSVLHSDLEANQLRPATAPRRSHPADRRRQRRSEVSLPSATSVNDAVLKLKFTGMMQLPQEVIMIKNNSENKFNVEP